MGSPHAQGRHELRELKTVSVSFRVSPRFKRALRSAADAVNRTQTNFLETLLFDYCDKNGIAIDQDDSDADDGEKAKK